MSAKTQADIFLDETLLAEDYLPSVLIGRDRESQSILQSLAAVTQGHKGIHLWLHGPPGSGKTVVAKAAIKQLADRHAVRSVVVNCWNRQSRFEILDRLIGHLKVFCAEAYRSTVKLERLARALNGRPLLVLLNEADKMPIRELADTLSGLDELGCVTIICTSNSTAPLANMEQRLWSRIQPQVIAFEPYGDEDLLEILSRRAQQALMADSWTLQQLKQISTIAAGDARVAIQTLRRAALAAQCQQRSDLSTDDISAALIDHHHLRQTQILDKLTEDHRLVFKLVKSREETLSSKLYRHYQQRCRQIKRPPVASRTFNGYLNQLTATGLIDMENARGKGHVHLVRVNR